jgi:hypothetical protein
MSAPPTDGHRSDAGDHDYGGALRPMIEPELQTKLGCKMMLRRRASSPRIFLDGLRRRLSTEASSVSPIPARCCGRDRLDVLDSMLPCLIVFTRTMSKKMRSSRDTSRSKGQRQSAVSRSYSGEDFQRLGRK